MEISASHPVPIGGTSFSSVIPNFEARTTKSVLTPRELQVLRLLADGLTTKGVAVQLSVSFKTAACHRSRILQKLGVDSTVLAVRWAIRSGIVEP